MQPAAQGATMTRNESQSPYRASVSDPGETESRPLGECYAFEIVHRFDRDEKRNSDLRFSRGFAEEF